MAAGCRSLYALASWGQRASPELRRALGFRRGTTPSVATLFRIFRDVDCAAFEEALAGWAEGQGVPRADPGPDLLGLHGERLPGVETTARCAPLFGAPRPLRTYHQAIKSYR